MNVERVDSKVGPPLWMRVAGVASFEPLDRDAEPSTGYSGWGAAEHALGRLDLALADRAARRRWLSQAIRLEVFHGQALKGRLVAASALSRRLGDPKWSPSREHGIDQAADVWRALTSAITKTDLFAPDGAGLYILARRATLAHWQADWAVPAEIFPGGLSSLGWLVKRWSMIPPGSLLAASEALRVFYEERAFGCFTARMALVLAPVIGCHFAETRYPCLFLGSALARQQQLLNDSYARGQEGWTCVFLRIAHEAALGGLKLKVELEHVHEMLTRRCRGMSRSSPLPQAVDFLFESPVFYAEELAKELKLTRAGANKLVAQLVKAEVIEEISDSERRLLYCSKDVLNARG